MRSHLTDDDKNLSIVNEYIFLTKWSLALRFGKIAVIFAKLYLFLKL